MGYGVGYQAASDASMNERDKLTARIAELEAAILAAKALLHPTNDATEDAWQILDDAYHRTTTANRS